MAGEQFALPDAVPVLARGAPHAGQRHDLFDLELADPLNLSGIVTAGARAARRQP
jgi:hypothetical protein